MDQQELEINAEAAQKQELTAGLRKYFLLTTIVAAGIFIGFKLVHWHPSALVPSVNTPAPAPAVPVDLIINLDARLAYLQSRVSGTGFFIHTVGKRENLWGLSKRRHYSVHSIIGCNPQLETYNVSIGQKIVIPSRPGTLHVARKGDTLAMLAGKYRIPADTILKYNPLGGRISAGDMLFIPDRRPLMEYMNDEMREKYELRALFVSPLGGRLSSTFGMRKHPVTGTVSMHGGIDIAVPSGTWVGAAADGVVIVAATDVGHYGTAVFIDHQDGYITHYGHLSKIMVHVGQHVKAHQLIAKSGATGRVTGPHLHFTIKKDGVAKDPLKFIW